MKKKKNPSFAYTKTDLEGLIIIHPFYVEDKRGYFLKSFEKDIYKSFGLNGAVFEDFESLSSKNVVRGLHLQTKNPQTKIVRAIKGEIMDVVVDLRPNSKTFGEWRSFILSDKNHDILWIPSGFAHGFKVISNKALVSYKCIGKYEKNYDTGIIWNDKTLMIDWNIDNPIISERDAGLFTFEEYKKRFLNGRNN